MVLLHGFPEFWYSWRFQIPVLAQNFKVVVPDLRGYNDSDKPNQGYDINTLSQDVVGLIQGLGYERAHVVGHDCGGMIAWNIAQHFPEVLQSLALLNTPHPYRFIREISGSLEQIFKHWHMFAVQVPGLPEFLIQNNLGQFVKKLLSVTGSEKSGIFSRCSAGVPSGFSEKRGDRSITESLPPANPTAIVNVTIKPTIHRSSHSRVVGGRRQCQSSQARQ